MRKTESRALEDSPRNRVQGLPDAESDFLHQVVAVTGVPLMEQAPKAAITQAINALADALARDKEEEVAVEDPAGKGIALGQAIQLLAEQKPSSDGLTGKHRPKISSAFNATRLYAFRRRDARQGCFKEVPIPSTDSSPITGRRW